MPPAALSEVLLQFKIVIIKMRYTPKFDEIQKHQSYMIKVI